MAKPKALGYKDGNGNYGFVMYDSGSIKLGNDSTDVIAMTGSIEVIGGVSSSANITASGHVKASSLHADEVRIDKAYVGEIYSVAGNREMGVASGDVTVFNDFRAGINNNPDTLVVDRSEDKVAIGKNLPLSSDAHILEVYGDISASANISGSAFYGGAILTGLTVDTSTLHVDTTNNRVGINTTSPSASLTISGDADDGIVSLRLGANQNAGVSNYSARIEMAEDTDDNQVMNYGAFFDYDGDAASPDLGVLKIGMRDNSTTDTDIVKISRKAGADTLVIDSNSLVTVPDLTVSDDLFVNDFARIDALRVGTTSTDPGDGNLYVEGDITLAGGDIKDSGGHDRISFGNTSDLIIKDYSGNTEMTIRTSGVDIEGDLLGKSHGRIAGEFSVGTRVIVGDSLANINDSQGLIQIKQESDAANGGGLTIEQSLTSDEWTIWHSTAENLNFSFNGTSKGYLNDSVDVDNIDFTGQHRCTPSTSTTYSALSSSVGKIVVSDGTYSNLSNSGISVNEAIPKVKLSNARNQKSAFGVVSNAEDENSTTREYTNGIYTSISEKADASDNRLYINSLGEGGVWISNINGNLENGDYITTCEIPGYGMKQDDDLLHNYTVAKITMDCDFDQSSSSYDCVEIQHSGSTYRAAFVGCTYHCG